MNRVTKILMALTVVALVAIPFGTVFAARVVQGALLDTGTPDPFGQCVKERIWSASDAVQINPHPTNCGTSGVGSCSSVNPAKEVTGICNRGFLTSVQGTGRAGYQSHADGKENFAADVDPQFMYILWDQIKGAATPDYVGYYYITGQSAANADTGRIVDNNCTGTTGVACFLPGNSVTPRRAPANSGTRLGVVNPIGGFGPIPIPTVTGVAAGQAQLSWTPHAYFANEGAADVFSAYRLEQYVDANLDGTCQPPLWNNPGWTVVTSTASTTHNATLPGSGDCVFYSNKLVYNGPASRADQGGAAGELVTVYRSQSSQAVSLSPSVIVIAKFSATYAGKNTMNVTWTTGSEAGISGFYVNRATSAGGPYTRVSEFIAATGDNSVYTYPDKINRSMGSTFYYMLDIVNKDGTTGSYGPTSGSLPSKGR